MILAAGQGSRLQPFTVHSPKPLVPLLGVPSIQYTLLRLPRAGVKTVVVNVHAHAEQITAYVGHPLHRKGLDVKISDESGKLLGSAGGFRKAVPLLESTPGISESFFGLNADVISSVNLATLASKHQELRQKQGVVMTLALAHGRMLADQTGSYTEFKLDEANALVTGVGPPKNGVPFYTGIGVFETSAFTHLKEGIPAEFVPEVLIPWIERNKVGFIFSEELWMDLGTPELWWKAHFTMMKKLAHGMVCEEWKSAITEGMKSGYFSEEKGIVDYESPGVSAPADSGQGHYIRWKGTRQHV